MNYQETYTSLSLELHLFFARIMKEHALFLKAGFTSKDSSYAMKAEEFQQAFEHLLCETVTLADGIVSCEILNSGEVITEFTALAEEQTECLTGIQINKNITEMENCLYCGNEISPMLCCQVEQINQTAIQLLDGLITWKEEILNHVIHCHMFTTNYPSLIEHLLQEAKLYRMLLCNYESGLFCNSNFMPQNEQFWNHIMMEHAQFIHGMLDPSENELIMKSNGFVKDYKTLLSNGASYGNQTLLLQESLKETTQFREFKTSGVKGIEECKIHSVILPLLADHVLREANHYIRILRFQN